MIDGLGEPHDVAVEGVRFSLHRLDPPRRRRTTPALLLHGVPETALMWRGIATELRRDRTVLAPDLKGLGGSEDVGRYDLGTLARELAALILHEADGPVDVIGHDWGGRLALSIAELRPELVRRLVVVNAPYRHVDLLHAIHIPLLSLPVVPEVAFRHAGEQLVRGTFRVAWRAPTPIEPDVLDQYVAAYADPARVRAMLAYYREVMRPRLIRVPRRRAGRPGRTITVERQLVLWGAADPVLPLPVGEAVVRDLGPQTRFVTIPGAGHFPVEEAPEVAGPAIIDFVRAGATA